MKKKFAIDWLSIMLISVFSFDTILYICLFIYEHNVHNLISLILYPSCLVVYVAVLIFSKLYVERKYLLIYDNYFELYGKSIFDSKIISKCNNKKYLKYGLLITEETRYEFSYNELIIHFGIISIEDNKKIMIIYSVKNTKDDFYETFFEAKKRSEEHYYEHNNILPLNGDNIFYKNKRNAFEIKEINGKFIVLKYRYYVPVDVHDIKNILKYKPGWDCIGDSHDDGIESFETHEKAKEYISYLM